MARVQSVLVVAMEHSSQEIIVDIKICIDFKMLKVKVPIIFSGT